MHPVRAKRFQKELTLHDLHKLTNIDPTEISRLERCERPLTVAHLRKLARALQCDEQELIPTQEEEVLLKAIAQHAVSRRAKQARTEAKQTHSHSATLRATRDQVCQDAPPMSQELTETLRQREG